MYICIYACMHVCLYVCMYVCLLACMYVCTILCMFIKMWMTPSMNTLSEVHGMHITEMHKECTTLGNFILCTVMSIGLLLLVCIGI